MMTIAALQSRNGHRSTAIPQRFDRIDEVMCSLRLFLRDMINSVSESDVTAQ
jgi:hypothetical protein